MEQEKEQGAEELKAAKQAAFSEESERIAREVPDRARGLVQQRLADEEKLRHDRVQAAREALRRADEELSSREREFLKQLEVERKTKEEMRIQHEREEKRRREEEERKRKAEEERRRAEEEAVRRAEENRRKYEEEMRRQEEERRSREEEDRRRTEEEQRRKEEALRKQEEERLAQEERRRKKEEEDRRRVEEEIRRKEGERRKQEEERRERIISLIASARVLLANNDYENALVEVAKALVNDPANADALALEQTIREAQGKAKPAEPAGPAEPVEPAEWREKTIPITSEGASPVRKGLSPRGVALIAVAALAVLALVLFQVKKKMFPSRFSLAVLPWTSASNDVEETVLGVSIAEEVANRLEHIRSVSVMGYSSASGLSRYSREAPAAVFGFGFPYALRGSVQKAGDTYGIDVSLVDSLGTVAWSHSYRTASGDLWKLPGDVVEQLMAAMDAGTEAASSVRTAHRGTQNSSSYLFFLRGLELLHRRTPESALNAYELFHQAFEQDPGFAEAAAFASLALGRSVDRNRPVADSVMRSMESLALQSIAVNPELSEGHLALSRQKLLHRQYKAAVAEADSAIVLAPNKSEGYVAEAQVYLETGEYARALGLAKQAYALDPRDLTILQLLAGLHQLNGTARDGYWYHETALFFARDSTEYITGPMASAIMFEPEFFLNRGGRVRKACGQRLTAHPDDGEAIYSYARLMQVSGDALEAGKLLDGNARALQLALKSDPDNPRATMLLAVTLTRLGRYPEAASLARRMEELHPSDAAVLYRVAQTYALQLYSVEKKQVDAGKKENALRALRNAVAVSFDLTQVTDADFYNLFDQQEFRSAIRCTSQ